ncbi:hypothetical protein NLU66_07775 [Brachybacterium sp. NBEC-018]|uniref:hypothetical protein n=1 Tax=Brachybacterium sp. NBEC-018 TaxID=2996004 RepID=UPI00217558BA|nr:hypothetical protein [Brachybacterium sp. NBEC-018]UVY85476.1 hypothetical protein NLU66_07775 [Brachybacterium sp. NBEC-018]
MDHGAVRWGSGVRMLGAAALLLAAAAGCGAPEPAVNEAGLTWITLPDSREGDAALLLGTVAEVRGCLVVRGDEGEDVYPVFGRSDARPRSFTVGQYVELGGGSIEASDTTWRTSDSWTVPEACRGAEELWIVAPE